MLLDEDELKEAAAAGFVNAAQVKQIHATAREVAELLKLPETVDF